MNLSNSMDVIGSALTAERTRLNAIASNVANANSVSRVGGDGPYRRKDVILSAKPLETEFTQILDRVEHPHTEVVVESIHEDTSAPRKVYQPEHPMADASGYIEMPNVNPVQEMANMISAERAFQQNVNIFQTTKQMALKSLEIGK